MERIPLKALCEFPHILQLHMEDPTFPRFLTSQTVGQSVTLCSHQGQALSHGSLGVHITYPGLLEDSLRLGLLRRDHGALRTGIATTSKPELQEQGEKLPEVVQGTHSEPRARRVSWPLSKAETPNRRT